jgi:predicted SnoaL-like aldol condensation-catalyzing enzyme
MQLTSKCVCTSLLAISCFGLFTTTPLADDSLSNKDKAIAVISSIETGDQNAIQYINPEKYIQHNLAVSDGLAGFGEVFSALPEGSAKAKVLRAAQDGDYVFLHTQYDFFGPKSGFDIFRFEEGKIVEHWDNLQPVAQPNPSGRTQFDGATEITDLDKTEENKALVADFVDTILVNGDMSKIDMFIGAKPEDYLQHNTMVADGLDGLGAALQALADAGTPMVYSKNHKILGEGNFVLSVSEGTFMGKPTSFYDLFRIDAGKIVEHWDTIEAIPSQDQWKNSNGKFGFQHDYVVEVATFNLSDGVTGQQFEPIDLAVEQTHVSKQPGFISRESGMSDEGYWRVIVHWASFEDADASMASFMNAPAAAEFMNHADGATMIMRRYAH